MPDRRWFPSGSNVPRRVVSQLLLGPSPWQGSGVLFSAFPTGTEQEDAAGDQLAASRRSS